jgi:hypothetical protein
MFAIDGVKLPSNASKQKSGSRADFEWQAERYETAARSMLARHRQNDIRHNKRLNRFTLRGRQKVDTQWKLYCLVHNIEKLAHHGYGQ